MVSLSGLLNTRDLMSSLRFPIRESQIGKCPPLAHFSLLAPVTTQAISKPPLFSALAIITSLVSRPLSLGFSGCSLAKPTECAEEKGKEEEKKASQGPLLQIDDALKSIYLEK